MPVMDAVIPVIQAVLNFLPAHWLIIIVLAIALLIGGLGGALIYAAVVTYRYRKPPIGYRIEVFPTFTDICGASCSRSQITISDGDRDYPYNDLQLVQIHLANQSHHDFDHLQIGISLPAEQGVVYVEVRSPDRSHQIKQLTPLSFAQPQSQVDLLLCPLNREDHYSLRLLVILAKAEEALGQITLSSPQAVQFVDLPTVQEAVQEAAKSTSISLGPFSFSFDSYRKEGLTYSRSQMGAPRL